MPVNWGMGLTVDQPKMDAMEAFRAGQDRRREHDARNALTQYATDQTPESLNALTQFAPEFVIKEKQALHEREQAGMAQQREGTMQMARLLNHATDETTYQQAMGAARQLGMDVSSAPPQFDPAWVSQQKMIVNAFAKDGGQSVSGIARELIDAGYKPGTPEFQQAMAGVINNKYATDYVDEVGNTRRRSTLNLGAQSGGPQPGVIEDGFRFKGGNPADPDAWEPVEQGGQQGAPAGNFLGGPA